MNRSVIKFGLGIALVWGPTFFAMGCQKKDSDSPVSQTLGFGDYSALTYQCRSTGQSPAYPDPAKKAALNSFDGITSHTIALNSDSTTESIVTADCTMTIARTIHSNGGGRFSFADYRQYTFEPENCRMPVAFEGGVFTYGADSSVFQSADRAEVEEIPFELLSAEPPDFTFVSLDEEPHASAWAAFGCAAKDQIQRILTQE